MRRLRACLALIGLALAGRASIGAPLPPAITGIDHVSFYESDTSAAASFYTRTLGARRDHLARGGERLRFSDRQFIELVPAPRGTTPSRLHEIAFATTDAAAMRRRLDGVPGISLGPLERDRDGRPRFTLLDPEGNRIAFVQVARPRGRTTCYSDVACHIGHAGFFVRDLARQRAFYRDLLGFRDYWRGGLTPDKLDWVSQQVPDGPDWLEFMLAGPGASLPLDRVDAKELGGMNHVSLVVTRLPQRVAALVRAGRLTGYHDGPLIGLDGKWQAHLYDPDGSRTELMEPRPVRAPCCSPYRAPHPVADSAPVAGNGAHAGRWVRGGSRHGGL